MASVPNRWTASAAAEIGNNNEKAAHVPQPTHLHRNGGADHNISDPRSKLHHIVLTMASMSWALFAILVVIAIAAEDSQIKEKDHILVLNSKNFDKATKEFTQLLVEWYSPSCGHCKALEPGKRVASRNDVQNFYSPF